MVARGEGGCVSRGLVVVVVVACGTDRDGEPPPPVACRGQEISPGAVMDRGGDHARVAAPTTAAAPTAPVAGVSRDKVTHAVRGLIGPGLATRTTAFVELGAKEVGAEKVRAREVGAREVVVVVVMWDISSGVNDIGASAAAATITVPWADRNVNGAGGPDNDDGGGAKSPTDDGLAEILAGTIGSKRDTGGAKAMAHRRGVTAVSVGAAAAVVVEVGVICAATRNGVVTVVPDKGGGRASTDAAVDDNE